MQCDSEYCVVKTRQQAAYTRVGWGGSRLGGNTPGQGDKNTAIIFSELAF